MGLELEYINGQTPIEEEEIQGLLINTITTRGELDEFEQKNIEEAIQWTMQRSFKKEMVLTESFIRSLHKRMYGKVWAWAGKFRKTERNIGINSKQISVSLKNLLDDTLFWLENNTYPPDEIAVRFKHRLVSIHCFPNGNGRHSRLMADIIIEKICKEPRFTWGEGDLSKKSQIRDEYIAAVKEADKNNYQPLLAFARS
jgi:Fic-DOC domain mobile mystery protein B